MPMHLLRLSEGMANAERLPGNIETLARLARLGLSKDEEHRYAEEFRNIVDFVGQVEAVQADNPPPLRATISGVQHVVRDDASEPSALAGVLLAGAPDTQGGCVKVPSILRP